MFVEVCSEVHNHLPACFCQVQIFHRSLRHCEIFCPYPRFFDPALNVSVERAAAPNSAARQAH
jgi:hypothetical protein